MRSVFWLNAAAMRDGKIALRKGRLTPSPLSPTGLEIWPLNSMKRSPSGAMKARPSGVVQSVFGAKVPAPTPIWFISKVLPPHIAAPHALARQLRIAVGQVHVRV